MAHQQKELLLIAFGVFKLELETKKQTRALIELHQQLKQARASDKSQGYDEQGVDSEPPCVQAPRSQQSRKRSGKKKWH